MYMKNILNTFANLNLLLGVALLIIPVAFLLFSGVNNNSYTSIKADNEVPREQIVAPDYVPVTNTDIKADIIVPQNEAITYGYRVKMPSHGLDTLIYECATPECGLLKNAAWRIPEFGTPEDEGNITVLAAHRWGPDNFSTEKRIKELFYSFDKVKEGDLIEIEWNSKIYKYQVSFKEENTVITRDEDDLILFTCKYYDSPVRIVVYAKLIK